MPNRLIALLVALALPLAALAQNKVPVPRALEALVKVSLLSLNDAVVTGNYTVFHAKLSKPFRDKYSATELGRVFKDFADRHIDYDVIAAFPPTYDPAPAIDGEGKLVVKGFFPTEPARVLFDLTFIPSDGEWKLLGIDVKVRPAKE
jgi:hypothetical protein